MNTDLQPRRTEIEMDPGGFWWVYSNGQKIAKTWSKDSAKRIAFQFAQNGYLED